MIDLEPRLHSELRSEYERLEAESPPAWLVNFDPRTERRRRRAPSILVGVVSLAVIASALATFGVELSSHLRAGPPATHAPMPAAPMVTTTGFPLSARILIPVTRGAGTTVLSNVVSTGKLLYIAFDCDAGALLKIQAASASATRPREADASLVRCASSSAKPGIDVVVSPGSGVLLKVSIEASPSTRWAIVAAEGDVSTGFPSLSPVMPESEIPLLLVADTYGTGVASLPTFTPATPYWIEFACLGGGPISIRSSDGNSLFTSEDCASPGLIGLTAPPDQVDGSSVSLVVQATASTTWELRVVQDGNHSMPQPFEMAPAKASPGTVWAKVLLPVTRGKGSETLPTFTPTMPFYGIDLSCSGPGLLTIDGPPGSTESSVCDMPGTDGGFDGQATLGVPISLKVTADPETSWVIVIYEAQKLGPQP
jgi:hypothetical protein